MKKIFSYNGYFFRYLLAFSMLGVLLLSSCSVKRGIKILFDIPVQNTIVGSAGGHQFTVSPERTACFKCADLQVLTNSSLDQLIMAKLSPAVLISIAFALLLAPLFPTPEKQRYRIPLLTGNTPKYLLFSKLIFYDRS